MTVGTAVVAEPYAGMEPISLEEMVDEAALLARVDRKYVLPLGDVDVLLDGVPRETRVLEIDGVRDFGYRSVYLDTPDRQSFLTSGRGRRGRWKVRTREYLDTGTSWLEVKTHGARGQTIKQRIEQTTDELTAEGRAFVTGIVPTAIALEPVMVTTYRRSTLLLPGSEARPASRVTIDVDLGWAAIGTGRSLDRPRLAIVETKTGATPSAADRLLWSHGHRPVSISKFGVGMAALHPDLPRLKWHRVMNRFGVPRAA
ncbi:MAG: polyphosphate polymerase domain-containing protein [Nocardioides sp.]|uniref:polyphosphate polymerase domain-containing protein n=1 Tax=Nocardioides sp. TaxID=35761 RepID=UPI0039E50C78